MSLLRIILWRITQSIFVLLSLSVFLFLAVEILPGDLASATAPRFVTSDQIEFSREELGLNRSPITRYFDWISQILQGNLGVSWSKRAEIAPLLAERLSHTALLGLMASCLSIPIGFAAALIAVINRGSIFDRLTTGTSLAVIAMPEFLIAYLLMTIFVVTIPIFPAHTVFTDEMRLADRLHAMALPAATLAIAGLAPVLRVSRACLISVLASDYIEMAKLKGISITRIITIHALPNVLPPIINMVVLLVANYMVAAFIVEEIFSYPGIGKMMIAAVKFRDIPLVLATGMVFAFFFVILNLIADLLSIMVSPKLRDPSNSRR